MAVKLNSVEELESLNTDLFSTKETIKLSKEITPKAYEAKVEELLEEKVCATREEAEQLVNDMEFSLELYYEKGKGLFIVESEAVEYGDIYSPYTGEHCEDWVELKK